MYSFIYRSYHNEGILFIYKQTEILTEYGSSVKLKYYLALIDEYEEIKAKIYRSF